MKNDLYPPPEAEKVIMEQLTLFGNDPAMRMRDSRGRFATPERAYADKAIAGNRVLRLQVEKYKRAWIAASEISARYHHELVALKAKYKDLLKKMNHD